MKQRYDYRGFSLKKLPEPRFAHVQLLWGWVAYFVLYFVTENLIPPERCTPIHCWLDDVIPFCEWFAIFYVGWYALVFGSLLYTFFFDVPRFRKIQVFIMITQAVAMVCYILFPSRQDLRPEVFPRENLLTALMGFIYSFDTSTGVCPSLHAAYSLGILSAGLKDRDLSPLWKVCLTLFVLGVCAGVCFVKQHSALDVLAALPVCLLAEVLVYGKDYWLPRIKRRPS